jgi:hypothetical protein
MNHNEARSKILERIIQTPDSSVDRPILSHSKQPIALPGALSMGFGAFDVPWSMEEAPPGSCGFCLHALCKIKHNTFKDEDSAFSNGSKHDPLGRNPPRKGELCQRLPMVTSSTGLLNNG